MPDKRVGILVGGGPAPGINAVIGAATIEAVNQGFEVVGFYDGFKWLTSEKFNADKHMLRLDIRSVARIHFDGGSILRTARANLLDPQSITPERPARPDGAKLQMVLDRLEQLGVTHLITIGGDDTALSARFVSDGARGRVRLVHVPKTIDNDLPLPGNENTFGFSTARFGGTRIVKSLMQDSLTTGRWYVVTVMGRSAGWLAMAIGQAAGATLSLIPEEFDGHITLAQLADVVDGAMLKRQVAGRTDGVAVVAEGLAYKLGDRKEIEQLLGREVPVDAAGHMRLSDVPLGFLLRQELEGRYKARGEKINIVTHMLGYELRSEDPTPFDMAYCRLLGHGCVQFLKDPGDEAGGVMVALDHDNIVPIKLADMVDPATNRIHVRRVDVESHIYRVARAYMIRLENQDLQRPAMLERLARAAQMSPDAFRERYRPALTCRR